jgi:hypothetical protein
MGSSASSIRYSGASMGIFRTLPDSLSKCCRNCWNELLATKCKRSC